MTEKKKEIPVLFQKMDEYQVDDTRFAKVKIWLMHLEENFNGSYFSKGAVMEAIPSLANTPILGFIEPNMDDEDDFSDHRREMKKNSDGEWSFDYQGQAFGTIPESNNAKFEWRLCDDGVEREFLTVEGLLWTKWDDAIDIMNKSFVKGQSMEIHKDYEGFFNKDDGLYHYTRFSFFGACLLGLDYEPAMINSTVELDFNLESFEKDIQEKMEKFKLFQANERGKTMDKEFVELLEKFSKTKEEMELIGVNFEEVTLDELETKLEEATKVEDAEEDFAEDAETIEVEETEETEVVTDETETEEVEEVEEEAEEVVTEDFEKLYEDLKVQHEELSIEVAELKEFKATKVAEERKSQEDELFDKYKILDGIEDYEAIKSKSSEFKSAVDIEKEIALVYVKNQTKLSFTRGDDTKDTNSFDFDKEETPKVGKYGNLFEKYGK